MKTARLNSDLLGNPQRWLLISTCQMMIKSIAILSLKAIPHLPRRGLSIRQISVLQLYNKNMYVRWANTQQYAFVYVLVSDL